MNVWNSSSKFIEKILKVYVTIFVFRALRERDDAHSRLKTIAVLSVLLQGPFDTGNAILGSQNLVDLMIQMAGSGDPLQEVLLHIDRFSISLSSFSVLQWKQLFCPHRKKIKQLVFYH